MEKNIRLLSQQLINPGFEKPEGLVSWMGAIQAQNYEMSKWAIGIRLKSASLAKVEEALRDGRILRTHIMRPTWHLVTAEDIRWMLKLSAKRIKSSWGFNDKEPEADKKLYFKVIKLVEKQLEGNNHLTKDEIIHSLTKAGINSDRRHITSLLQRAEVDAIICSGADKGNKPTYALLEERATPQKELHKDEALAMLATKYFRSHSPASLPDFVWWSGLSISEARHAIGLISTELIVDKLKNYPDLFVHKLFYHDSIVDDTLHLLPSYDEYLISYKGRTHVLDKIHYPKAFTNYGIFYPVVVYNGKVIGNWNKGKKGIDISLFDQDIVVDNNLVEIAKEKYRRFIS